MIERMAISLALSEHVSLGLVGHEMIFYLPYQHPPYLLMAPQVWDHLNVEEVFGIGDAGEDGGSDDAEKEIFGDGGGGETRR